MEAAQARLSLHLSECHMLLEITCRGSIMYFPQCVPCTPSRSLHPHMPINFIIFRLSLIRTNRQPARR